MTSMTSYFPYICTDKYVDLRLKVTLKDRNELLSCFPQTDSGAEFSTPAFSTHALWCHVPRQRVRATYLPWTWLLRDDRDQEDTPTIQTSARRHSREDRASHRSECAPAAPYHTPHQQLVQSLSSCQHALRRSYVYEYIALASRSLYKIWLFVLES